MNNDDIDKRTDNNEASNNKVDNVNEGQYSTDDEKIATTKKKKGAYKIVDNDSDDEQLDNNDVVATHVDDNAVSGGEKDKGKKTLIFI